MSKKMNGTKPQATKPETESVTTREALNLAAKAEMSKKMNGTKPQTMKSETESVNDVLNDSLKLSRDAALKVLNLEAEATGEALDLADKAEKAMADARKVAQEALDKYYKAMLVFEAANNALELATGNNNKESQMTVVIVC